MMSLRPPLSSGQLQSRITEVSLMEEITFRGAEGGPGRQRRGEIEVKKKEEEYVIGYRGGENGFGWVERKLSSTKEIEEREMRGEK